MVGDKTDDSLPDLDIPRSPRDPKIFGEMMRRLSVTDSQKFCLFPWDLYAQESQRWNPPTHKTRGISPSLQ